MTKTFLGFINDKTAQGMCEDVPQQKQQVQAVPSANQDPCLSAFAYVPPVTLSSTLGAGEMFLAWSPCSPAKFMASLDEIPG